MKLVAVAFSLFICSCTFGQTITTIAGSGLLGFSGEGGPAVNAEFSYPAGVTTDRFGNIFIADFDNIVIQKIDTNGILTRFAGNGISGFSGDGGPATAAQLELNVVVGMTVDSNGNLFFSDGNRIRAINGAGNIRTVAGIGIVGDSGENGPATVAKLASPVGLCFDKYGNLCVADQQNDKIKRISPSGIITTIAGDGTTGFGGDGGAATLAKLNSPSGIAIDDSNNIFIADFYNAHIRKINASGVINTIAGVDKSSFGPEVCISCSALSIALWGPDGIAVDHLGNVYVSCVSSNAIHLITKDGMAHTVAGTSVAGYSGDGGPASSARLYFPTMIAVDNAGNLLVTDKGNGRYRKVWMSTTIIPPIKPSTRQLLVYPNPTHGNFTCDFITDTNDMATMAVKNIYGQVIFTKTFNTNTPTPIVLNAPPGIYFVTAAAGGEQAKTKIVLE